MMRDQEAERREEKEREKAAAKKKVNILPDRSPSVTSTSMLQVSVLTQKDTKCFKKI